VRFALTWEMQRATDRNWHVFCHLVDLETELHVATRDRYPGQGLLATSLMEPGLRWVDEYAVELPTTAYAPSQLAIEVGLYDGDERPPIRLEGGDALVVDNGLRFEVLRVVPKPGKVPNATWVNFQDRMALVGWQVEPRVAGLGTSVELELHWRGLKRMNESYTVSTQLVNREQRKAAQEDRIPGDLDTTAWEAGERVTERRQLRVTDDAPLGGYDILLSAYAWDREGELQRLRVIDEHGRVLPQDSVLLGQIRIVP
jgi:hypothetical protein